MLTMMEGEREIMNNRISKLAISFVLLLSIFVAACGPATPVPVSEGEEELQGPEVTQVGQDSEKPVVIVIPADIQSLDKSLVNLYNDANVSNNIFDRLFQFSPTFEIEPMLATSYTLIDDTTWEFKLREGVTFHDGQPFNAAAVKASVEWAQRPDARIAGVVQNITEVEIVDDHTVRILTELPEATIPQRFAWIDMYPANVASIEAFGENPIGTGPYIFQEWKRGQYVRVQANADYWGETPALGEVYFRFVVEPSTRLAMLSAGEADLITNLNPENVAELEQNPSTRVVHNLGLRKMSLFISHLHEAQSNLTVRQALNYAIDRDSIIDNIFLGFAVKSVGMVQSTIPGHLAEYDVYYDYDPEKAKALLAEAGYPDGFDVTLYTPSGAFPKDKEAAEAIAAQLSEVGMRAQVEVMEWGKFFELVHSMKMDGLAHSRWGNTVGDPSEQYYYNFWSRGVRHYVTDPEVDRMFERAQTIMDSKQRIALFEQLEKHTIEEVVPWVWLYELENIYGVSQRLNWEPKTPEELVDLRGATLSK